ncbi:hypothetical protein SLEP1_g11703 [Rubroshorea leprosula]|nr:hypothetical protein SLEP1_g11703 [Rubroshorea leprosula]
MAVETATLHHMALTTAAAPKPKFICFSLAAYAKKFIAYLRSLDIPILPGLTDQEFASIESTFHFIFPPDLRSILQEGLPTGPSFPNWRSSSLQQLQIILNLPFLSLSKNFSLREFWSDSWGPKPGSTMDALSLVKQLSQKAPVLVPICRNCYIPSSPNLAGNPVFYIDGEDVRILSYDVTSFFQEVEFIQVGCVLKPFLRKNCNVNRPAWAATTARRIEFWTEVVERRRRAGSWWMDGGHFKLGCCLEAAFWRLKNGGWTEEEVREMMMMDGGDDPKFGADSVRDERGVLWHVRVLPLVLLRAGWTREDVAYSLDLQDDDKNNRDIVL